MGLLFNVEAASNRLDFNSLQDAGSTLKAVTHRFGPGPPWRGAYILKQKTKKISETDKINNSQCPESSASNIQSSTFSLQPSAFSLLPVSIALWTKHALSIF